MDSNLESNFNQNKCEIEEIVIEYRRGGNLNTPDALAIELSEDLIFKLKNTIDYNTSKATVLKVLDNSLYLIVHSLTLTIFVLGLYNGSDNLNSSQLVESTSKWFFTNSVLAAVLGFLTEISKRYKFNQRSLEIYKCIQQLSIYIIDLESLKISPKSAEEKIDKIKTIEIEIQPILLRIFDNQITNESPKEIKAIQKR